MCPPFYYETHSRRRHYSLMPDACETFRHASLYIKSPTSTKFPAVQADHVRPTSFRLLIHRCYRFNSATCPDWFCSIPYACLPTTVVESEIPIADFRQGGMFRQMCSKQVTQTGSGVLKTWCAKRNGLVFGLPCTLAVCIAVIPTVGGPIHYWSRNLRRHIDRLQLGSKQSPMEKNNVSMENINAEKLSVIPIKSQKY